MDSEVSISTFLFDRRTHLSRRLAGFPISRTSTGTGLRPDEMALAVGLSESQYMNLECGDTADCSTDELDDVATALHLCDDERSLLHSFIQVPLLRTKSTNDEETSSDLARLSWIPDNVDRSAILVFDSNFNIVGCNRRGGFLFEPVFSSRAAEFYGQTNFARFMFLDEAAHEFCANWVAETPALVASLRFAASNQPFGYSIRKLIGQLSCFSNKFRVLWSGFDLGVPSSGKTRLNHPFLGVIDLSYRTTHLSSTDTDEKRWTSVVSYSNRNEVGTASEASLDGLDDMLPSL